jgi:3-oxoadipate enol-lactonase
VTRMPVRSGYAPVDGTALYYEVAGAGSPVVLVHGFSLDHRMWDDQAAVLAGRYTVVRYDLRGFGRSAPAAVPYTHADDLKALLAHLGLERVILMGLSLGGGAALNFSIRYPEAVAALIAVDPSLGGWRWDPAGIAAQAAVRQAAQEVGVEAARVLWLKDPLFAAARANPAVAVRLEALVSAYSGWHWLHADPGRPLNPPALDRLHEIGAPALVVVGEHDVPDFQGIAETLARRIPGARKEVIPGAGHLVNLEQPERFNAAVLGFLDRLGHVPAR